MGLKECSRQQLMSGDGWDICWPDHWCHCPRWPLCPAPDTGDITPPGHVSRRQNTCTHNTRLCNFSQLRIIPFCKDLKMLLHCNIPSSQQWAAWQQSRTQQISSWRISRDMEIIAMHKKMLFICAACVWAGVCSSGGDAPCGDVSTQTGRAASGFKYLQKCLQVFTYWRQKKANYIERGVCLWYFLGHII